jgi:glycogen debranching enzyme/putative sterol carrier protein
MIDTVSILEGSTFVTSDRRGDIDGTPATPHGLFALDTRFLSRWRLTVDGQSPAVLSTDTQRHYCAQFFLAPSTGTTYVDSPLSVARRRWIDNGFREWIVVANHTPEPRKVRIHIEVDADFADLFEVKDDLEKKGELYRRVEDDSLVLGYVRESFRRETRIAIEGESGEITDDGIVFELDLPATGAWAATLSVQVRAVNFDIAQTAGPSLEELDANATKWRNAAPRLESDWRPLERAYEKSIDDLAALKLDLPGLPGGNIPAAGLPWFMSLFGRDSIITSYQALPFQPDLALATLRTLAGLQGRRVDKFRDEEPGKIPHELRFGELTAFEERPHSPYFGSADSTTLWLILLDEYERWSGREDVVRELEAPARAAIEWIDKYGDRDGDGYVEYERGVEATGLDNQCWKDSWDSIRFRDGRLAKLPRATCELQGYAYDAKLRAARLAREIWGDTELADRLEASAAELKERFNRDFWLDDLGYFALALDGDKQVVDALTSNIGHLLWSGIADDDKAAKCVEHLMSNRLFSGWGVRTMAQGEAAYNPIGYHVGTVWPHDNSIIAMGMLRYGYREEASRIGQALVEASTYFDARLPEAFAGYPRDLTNYPAEYPTACSPQAWATGAPLLVIRAMLGLEPQGARLGVQPVLPPAIGHLLISNLPGRWGHIDAGADVATSLVAALQESATAAPHSVRELFETLDRGPVSTIQMGSQASIGFRLGDAGDWLLRAGDGRVEVREGFDTADCVFEMTEATLLAILRGEQNTRTARLAGLIKVSGDFALASRLAQLPLREAA